MEEDKKVNTCIKCKLEIPKSAQLCTHCASSQSRIYNCIKTLVIIAGIVTAIVTASMHCISVFPIVKSTLFPNPNIEVLAFKSNSRLIIANNGDHELFISHVHYGSNYPDYADIAKETLSIVYDKPKENVKIDESHLWVLWRICGSKVPFFHLTV